MDFNAYWAPPLVYTLLLVIFLINDKVSLRLHTEVERAFRLMMSWVIFFCVQDAVWGLCDCGVIPGSTFFFFSSTVFHLSTVTTTFFWLYFVLTYLGVSHRRRNVFLAIDAVFMTFQFALVIGNFFTPLVFAIEDGRYVTGPMRYLVFFNQYVVYLAACVITFLYLIRIYRHYDLSVHKNFLTVFVATMAPVLLGIMQYLYPHTAFYSLSYFLACFIIHIFIVAKDRANSDKAKIFHSISKTFYSMHLIDLDKDKATHYIESYILTGLIKGATGAQEMLNRVIIGTANDDYRALLLDFVQLSNLSERMKDKPLLSCEFVGRNYGWTRITFVSIEKEGDRQKQVMVYTQIIDQTKRQEIELIFKSNNDELTGLFNRYAYENELRSHPESCLDDSLVFVAMDVNGLKVINDTLGHAAGDELIIGASTCMKRCFGPYGKIFRTGGDEFCAIIHATPQEQAAILRDFDDVTASWSGQLVDALSVSCGAVSRQDVADGNLPEMVTLADERMYENKAAYYRRKGIDRRGQRDAHIALCSLYTKILKINLTDDTFQVINMELNEHSSAMGYSDHISEWLHGFGKSGMVHPDDVDEYLRQTSIDHIRSYFAEQKTSLHIFYRRRIDRSFKQVMMEIVPTSDYSPEQEQFFLYVKSIDS